MSFLRIEMSYLTGAIKSLADAFLNQYLSWRVKDNYDTFKEKQDELKLSVYMQIGSFA